MKCFARIITYLWKSRLEEREVKLRSAASEEFPNAPMNQHIKRETRNESTEMMTQ